jgi:hypothetical protein
MKKYDLLLSFGCSFTEGGGLDNIAYHEYLKSGITSALDRKLYATKHSYPSYLAQLLGCDFKNFGTSAAGNEYILRNAYEESSGHYDKKLLVTVQTSVLSRMLLTSANDNTEWNINNPDGKPDAVAKYYTMYIEHFFNEHKEYDKLVRNTDLLRAWFKSEDIDFVFIGWESVGGLPPWFMNFPAQLGTLGNFSSKEKILIADLPNIPFNDRHFTEQGNQRVADLIFSHIKGTL